LFRSRFRRFAGAPDRSPARRRRAPFPGPCALGLVLLGVSFLAGCTTLTPQQGSHLEEVRAFVATAAQAYGIAPIPVRAEPQGGRRAATYHRGVISLSPDFLAPGPWRDVVLAHEVAHHLLSHDGPLPLEWDGHSQAQQRELDADAKAVEVLQRVRGLSEEEAFRLVYEAHWSLKRALEASPFSLPPGHPAPCVKLADLLRRFPAQQAWAKSC